jgi:hypothetical protein
MPSLTVTRLRSRIGDLGLPSIVWMVGDADSPHPVAFYDREKAQAYVAASPARRLLPTPLRIMDPNHR